MIGHISVREGITHEALTRILKDLHKYHVQIDYKDLPTTSKTLLKITPDDTKHVTIRDIHGPYSIGRGREKTGSYLHVGILKSLLLQSCGMVSKWQYVNTMRVVYTLFPDFIPEELYEVIRPQKGIFVSLFPKYSTLKSFITLLKSGKLVNK